MILACQGKRCKRSISVSKTGYGDANIVFQEMVQELGEKIRETWTAKFMTCGTCGEPYCDECAKKMGQQCKCGGQLSEECNSIWLESGFI